MSDSPPWNSQQLNPSERHRRASTQHQSFSIPSPTSAFSIRYFFHDSKHSLATGSPEGASRAQPAKLAPGGGTSKDCCNQCWKRWEFCDLVCDWQSLGLIWYTICTQRSHDIQVNLQDFRRVSISDAWRNAVPGRTLTCSGCSRHFADLEKLGLQPKHNSRIRRDANFSLSVCKACRLCRSLRSLSSILL